jgi:hypothetical protein
MALIMIAGRLDVYQRKVLSPDELTTPLFANAEGGQEELVSWVDREIGLEEFAVYEPGCMSWFAGETCSSQARFGDRTYHFSSPSLYWKQLAGRQGYLVVRDGRIARVIVTMLN